MSWKIIFPVCLLLVAAAPLTSFAESRTRPGRPSARTCSEKHDACTSYCLRAKEDLAELNECSRGCDIELLRCDRKARASTTTDAGTTTAPVSRDPG